MEGHTVVLQAGTGVVTTKEPILPQVDPVTKNAYSSGQSLSPLQAAIQGGAEVKGAQPVFARGSSSAAQLLMSALILGGVILVWRKIL